MTNFVKKRFKAIFIIVIITITGFLLYGNFVSKKSNKRIESFKVKKGTLKEKLTISGTVDAEEKVTLRFKTSGRLSWVGVKEGDHVNKYQAIASLDQREVKKKLDKELNDYMNERWDFDQTTKDDYKDKVITDAVKRVLEKAQFDLNNKVLDVEIQNLAVEYANLWTPIEGIVTYVEAPFAGVNITSTQAEFEVVNPKTVYFSALADQTEVVNLHAGLSGELILDAYEDNALNGSVKDIAFKPKSGETGTVYEVKFLFNDDNSDYKYRLGMTGDLEFTTKSKDNVLYIPLKFLRERKGQKYVEVDGKGKPKKVFVKTGMETDDDVEIVSGIEEGVVVYR